MTDLDRIEFGDFQTPPTLAEQVVALLVQQHVTPASVVEPTCGLGSFVEASLRGFTSARTVLALDINPGYVQKTALLARSLGTPLLECRTANFFEQEWSGILGSLPEPVLVIGNPPWVTASQLGSLDSANLPEKSNFQKRKGLDALTGKSNFDVAEWMLLKLLESASSGRDITVAMLVKTSVARRVLAHAWRTDLPLAKAEMFTFDAGAHFGVSVSACLLMVHAGRGHVRECRVSSLDQPCLDSGTVGWRDGTLVSDAIQYDRHRRFLAPVPNASPLRWRSGVKHDCARVMELRRQDSGQFINAVGSVTDLEPEYVYPLIKGSDLVHGRVSATDRWLIVTQCRPGEDTSIIASRAPKTWSYLRAHDELLQRRRSSIYKNRPEFSIFGVGPYTFSPWKVAISALHKRVVFSVVGPIDERPVVFDDTCYHLSCDTREEAEFIATLLNTDEVSRLLGSLVFVDAKRPVTVDILQRIDLERVADAIGLSRRFRSSLRSKPAESKVQTLSSRESARWT